MAVVNLANVASPTYTVVATPGTASGVAVAGNRVVVGDGTIGASFFDITSPLSPVLQGTQYTGGMSWDLLLAGQKLHVACEQLVSTIDLTGSLGTSIGTPSATSFTPPPIVVAPPEPPAFRVTSSLISLMPGNGGTVVRGARGAVVGMQPVTVELRNLTLGTSIPIVPVDEEGRFETTIAAAPGDHLLLIATSGGGEPAESDRGDVPDLPPVQGKPVRPAIR
jgi:hypothetical protein